MKRKFLLLSLLSSVCFSLASCGDTSSDTIEITFWTTTGKGIETRINEYATKFENAIKEKENVTIDIKVQNQGNYDSIKEKITQGLSSNNYPTIAVAYPDHVATYLSMKSSSVVNLNSLINDDKLGFTKDTISDFNDNYAASDIITAFYEEGQNYQIEGTYSIPFLKSSEVMVVNHDEILGQTFGSKVNDGRAITTSFLSDMTWDDLMNMCEYMVNNKSEFPSVMEEPLWIDSDSNFYITQSMQRGIDYLGSGDTADEKILFNNDKAKAMVKEFYNYYKAGYFTTKANEGGDYGSNAFKENKCLITLGSSGGVGYNDLGLDSLNGVGVYKIPSAATNDENTKYVSQGLTLCLMSNPTANGGETKDQEKINYAWRFVKYLLSPTVNTTIALSSEGYIPVRTSAVASDTYKQFIEESKESNNLLGLTADAVINQINGRYYNLPLFKGSSTARDAVEGIIAGFQTISSQDQIDQLFETAENNARSAL